MNDPNSIRRRQEELQDAEEKLDYENRRREREATKLIDSAKRYQERSKPKEALRKLETIIADYEGTSVYRQAQRLVVLAREWAADQDLDKAIHSIDRQPDSRVRERFEQVIESYPDSKAAAQAVEYLKDLEK